MADTATSDPIRAPAPQPDLASLTKRVPLATLHYDPANARKHGERNLEAIKGSLSAFGAVEPLVVQRHTGKVIGGNGRLEAMRALGWTHADVVELDVSNTEAAAMGIALNRTAELAEWDRDNLGLITEGLALDGFDLAAIGFDDGELAALLTKGVTPPADVDEGDVPEIPTDPVTAIGDLWQLGPHRIMCGDSGDPTAMQRLWGPTRAQLVMADPPYGVDYEGSQNKKRSKMLADSYREASGHTYDTFVRRFLVQAHDIAMADAAIYCWFSDSRAQEILRGFIASQWRVRAWIIWAKDRFNFSKAITHYRQKHEPCIYGSYSDRLPQWYGPNNEHTVWEHKKPNSSPLHPTQKPIEMYARCITNSTKPGDVISESFIGSGTTLIAATQLERVCYGMEISPAYCDVAIERWQQLTGGKATRS